VPTRSGLAVAGGGVGLLLVGRILGPIEFYVVGTIAVLAVMSAVLVRRFRPSRVSILRRVTPARVPAGEAARVDLEIVNHGRSRSPLLRIRDSITATRGVRLSIAPLDGLGRSHGAYRLPTTRRGVVEIGPMKVDDIDPMGLARRTHRVPDTVRLVVHPPIEPLPIARMPAGDDPLLGDELRQSLGISTEDFDGLREYVAGDDPRRIHWPSTAHHDELMVRQYRPPRHGRLTVVIDTRPPGDREAVLDRTTSVAASIAAVVLAAGDAVRIETTDGRSTQLLVGRSQLEVALEFLALLSGGSDYISSAIPAPGGTVVVVSADKRAAADSTIRANLARRLRATLFITCATEQWSTDTDTDGGGGTGDWVHLTGPGQLAALWRLPRDVASAVTT
jgi:uncharacterized protein (DUF58 family)